jgi:invasion protein IalB
MPQLKLALDARRPEPHDVAGTGDGGMGRTGLRVVLGLVILAAAAGAVWWFFGDRLFAPRPQVPAHIKPGYVGVTNFGSWRLICSRIAPTAPAAASSSAPNECRINHEVTDRARPGQVILAVNLGTTGTPRRPVVMLRLPPTAHTGDVALLRADDTTRARVPVTACSANECVAGGPIAEEDWDELLDARSLRVAFPARNRQRVLVNVPMNGLADAAHAMSLAQK